MQATAKNLRIRDQSTLNTHSTGVLYDHKRNVYDVRAHFSAGDRELWILLSIEEVESLVRALEQAKELTAKAQTPLHRT